MSAHADVNEILRWLDGFTAPPSMTYLVHGEPKALNALRERVAARGWNVHVPHHGETVSI